MFKTIFIKKHIDLYVKTIFVISLLFHLVLSFSGINYDLNNMYGFRQNQTAISTFYLIKEGLKLNYITPVLGAPWSIPMEFPLYQWIAAITVFITGISLNLAGRLVSITFFYLLLIPTYKILNYFIIKKTYILIILSLILASPVYIFWSRSFMVESTALFFTLLFFLSTLYFSKKSTFFSLSAGISTGILAGLTKTTTFIPLFFVAAFYYSVNFFKKKKLTFSFICSKILSSLLFFGIPILIAFIWTNYADSIKRLNPLAANFITSRALVTWNFGTLSQKLSFSTWKQIFSHSLYNLTSFNTFTILFFMFILIFPIVLKLKYYRHILISILSFFIGPLVFTNLYFVHHYYYYANLIFLLAALGFAILSYIETKSSLLKIACLYLVIPVLFSILYHRYFSYYYPIQMSNNINIREVSDYIKTNTKPHDVLVIYGYDWDSTLPYYSQRKALMLRGSITESESNVSKSIKNIGKENIKILVYYNQTLELSDKFIKERVNFYNLKRKPIKLHEFTLYTK